MFVFFYHSRADNCSQVWSLIHDSSYDVVISQGNHCSMNREAEIQLMWNEDFTNLTNNGLSVIQLDC